MTGAGVKVDFRNSLGTQRSAFVSYANRLVNSPNSEVNHVVFVDFSVQHIAAGSNYIAGQLAG